MARAGSIWKRFAAPTARITYGICLSPEPGALTSNGWLLTGLLRHLLRLLLSLVLPRVLVRCACLVFRRRRRLIAPGIEVITRTIRPATHTTVPGC